MSISDQARWERVQAIFHAVVEIEAGHQEKVLVESCGGDQELEAEVREILEEDRGAGGLLDHDLAELASQLTGRDTDDISQLDKQTGPYRILRLLGEGGMGVVYLAERSDLGGHVAIKFLRDASLSPARRRRFAVEQKTLAKLNHPGIARLYDADTLKDGTPWFVMEYVDGVPLTPYWSEHPGTVAECLQLFRRVCEPVLYAHGRAVIHRDLKPSNVLVASDGAVKLLDFGIAKQIDEFEENVTITGLRPMTPGYSAPEQQDGRAVGVFTDVYALGVLLYELLTGKLPFDRLNGPRNVEVDAPKPSSLAVAGSFTASISKSEWADLNVLCLTAMRPDVEHRYPSVEALIRDIDAFLSKRPLAARADNWRYKFRKFALRHRTALAYGAATVLLVTGVVAFYTARLQSARNAALAEARRTERIQQFTTDLFQGGDASAGPAEDLRVSALLERGRKQAESLKNDPEMQADMWETLGGIYRRLGDPQHADPLLSQALDKRRATLGARAPKVAQTLVELGLVRMDEAQLDEAERLVREGLEIDSAKTATVRPAGQSTVASDMTALGTVLDAKGKYPEAIDELQKALAMQQQTGAANAALAGNLRELANAHFYAGHYAIAEDLNQKVLAMHRTLYGEHHPEIAEDLNNLGAIQHALGRLPEAEGEYRQALAITEAWYGADHPHTAENLTSLSRTLILESKFDDAKPLLERALQIQIATHGDKHPAVASALNELGSLALKRDRYGVRFTARTTSLSA
jgi:serine/threonine-protein kinase